jgi:hypothetical protein
MDTSCRGDGLTAKEETPDRAPNANRSHKPATAPTGPAHDGYLFESGGGSRDE